MRTILVEIGDRARLLTARAPFVAVGGRLADSKRLVEVDRLGRSVFRLPKFCNEGRREAKRSDRLTTKKHFLQSEAPGLINFMLDGLRSIRAQRIVLTDVQMARVDELLGESDSVRRFMEDEVQLTPDGDLITDQLVRGQERYCQGRGWIAPSRAVVEKELHKLMLEMYNMTARNDVLRGGTARRGFGGSALKPEPYKPDQL